MSRYQRAVDDVVVDSGVCGACHGSGTYVGERLHTGPVLTECEACGGTGVLDSALQTTVIRELAIRNVVQPGYDKPTE